MLRPSATASIRQPRPSGRCGIPPARAWTVAKDLKAGDKPQHPGSRPQSRLRGQRAGPGSSGRRQIGAGLTTAEDSVVVVAAADLSVVVDRVLTPLTARWPSVVIIRRHRFSAEKAVDDLREDELR